MPEDSLWQKNLKISVAQALHLLDERIQAGETILKQIDQSLRHLDQNNTGMAYSLKNLLWPNGLRKPYLFEEWIFPIQLGTFQWTLENIRCLSRIFRSENILEEYNKIQKLDLTNPNDKAGKKVALNKTTSIIQIHLRYLKSIYKVMDSSYNPLSVMQESPSAAPPVSRYSNRVFIVHGHDEAAKDAVARVISQLSFEPIILQEQPNQGRTVIEKFEEYADVAFAVVLLTPDDVGAVKIASASPQARARQNVILELGFFIARLGRERVYVLYKGDVEIPSDFSGILWTPMDAGGAWRFQLGREMRAAGLSVDLNKL